MRDVSSHCGGSPERSSNTYGTEGPSVVSWYPPVPGSSEGSRGRTQLRQDESSLLKTRHFTDPRGPFPVGYLFLLMLLMY